MTVTIETLSSAAIDLWKLYHLQYDNVQYPFSKPIDVINAAAAFTITSHSNGIVVSMTSMVISFCQLGKKYNAPLPKTNGMSVHMSGIIMNLPRSALPVEISLFTGGIFGISVFSERST